MSGRDARRGEIPPTPRLSIILTATDTAGALARSLQALKGQAPDLVEILVVNDPGLTVPRLRRIGLEAAGGEIVAFLEDSCEALPGWAEAWIAAFSANPTLEAASGLVEHDDPGTTPLDRAVVYCEYAPFLPPVRPGRPRRLAGNNFAVRRELALADPASEVHETVLLSAIRGPVATVTAARVRHVRSFPVREAFADRFRYGREYGGLRTIGASPIGRWAGLVAGPAIFAVQVIRLSATIIGKPRQWARFLGCLPITLALLASWSLGEWWGWTRGPIRQRSSTARKPHERAGRPPGQAPGRNGSPRPGYTTRPPVS